MSSTERNSRELSPEGVCRPDFGVGASEGVVTLVRMRHVRTLRNPLAPLRDKRYAYRVPWTVDRSGAPHFRLVNTSDDELRGVTVSIAGSSSVRVSSPSSIRPGEAVRASLSGSDDPARDTLLIVRWFPPDGHEYLWQISF